MGWRQHTSPKQAHLSQQSRGRSHFRSVARCELSVPQSKMEIFVTRSFSVSGPKTWNTFPRSVKEYDLTFGEFATQLNTELFNRACAMYSYHLRHIYL